VIPRARRPERPPDRTGIALLVLLLAGALLSAFAPGAARAAGTPSDDSAAESAISATDAPVAVDRTPVPVPEPTEKALRYYRSGMALWGVGLLWGLLVPFVWLTTGWSARLRTFVSRLAGGRWYPTVALYFLLFLAISFLVDLPLAWYLDYVRPHAYDLSNQTLGKWLGDATKGLALGMVFTALFGWVPFLLLRRSPRRWWLWCAALSVPLYAFLTVVAPIWVDPLFNDFGPMKDKALEADILSLAEHAGIAGSRVFEVDKSVDTEAVNAYVAGLGATKRIVLWDTILAKVPRDGLLFVMAHEMGHYVLGHVLRSLVVVPLLVLAGLWLVHRSAGALLRRHAARFGFSELGDVAALPLISLLFGIAIFLMSPLFLAYSRHLEHEADRFGLELTKNNRAAAEAFVALQRENLGNPRPGWIYETWRASHPTLGERIDFCNTYRPWERGEPLVYGDRFRETP